MREMNSLFMNLDMKIWKGKRKKEAMAAVMNANPISSTDIFVAPHIRHLISSSSETLEDSISSRLPSSPNFFIPHNVPRAQPSLEGTTWNKEKRREARMAMTNFWYYNNLSFTVVSSPYWEGLVNALTIVNKGFRTPTNKTLSEKLLEEAIKNTWLVVDDQKEVLQRRDCNIFIK